MTGEPGVMLIREGQYALALLPGPAKISGLTIKRSLHVQGDCLPGAVSIVLLDVLLLCAGVRPPGLAVCQVVEQ